MYTIRKNQIVTVDFYVCEYVKGAFVGYVAGLGKNKGTWDTAHSKRSAQRHAARLRLRFPDSVFRVESMM